MLSLRRTKTSWTSMDHEQESFLFVSCIATVSDIQRMKICSQNFFVLVTVKCKARLDQHVDSHEQD